MCNSNNTDTMTQPWTEKYHPQTLKEIAGQDKTIVSMAEWAAKWQTGKPVKTGLLLYGPPGTGKSSAATALAKDMDWDIIELNASDKRTAKEIERIAGGASTSATLMGASRKRLIVMDEADNIHGNADRGGHPAVTKLLSQTLNPIILIANDKYKIPAGTRQKCLELNFRRLTKQSIVKVLSRVCEAEGIDADPLALNSIAELAENDLRSAINDLQAIAAGRKKLGAEDIVPNKRDRELNIFDAINDLLRAKTCQEARQILWDLDKSPEDAISWIDENIPRMLAEPADLAQVYEMLSRADIFLGRARRKNVYGMWSYASDLMSAGVSMSQEGQRKYTRIQVPSVGMMFRWTGTKRKLRDGVTGKIAKYCHTSKSEARKHYLPYFATIFRNNKDSASDITERLELEDTEVEFLREFGTN